MIYIESCGIQTEIMECNVNQALTLQTIFFGFYSCDC